MKTYLSYTKSGKTVAVNAKSKKDAFEKLNSKGIKVNKTGIHISHCPMEYVSPECDKIC